MSKCPVCSGPIEDSFGLIECPSCHKILFADFDGALKVHEDGESPSEEGFDEVVAAPAEEFQEIEMGEKEESQSGWDIDRKTHALANLDPEIEPESDFTAEEEKPAPSEPEVSFDAKSDFGSFQVEDAVVEDVIESVVETEPAKPSESGSLSTIQEINQFANSEVSSLRQGSLIYNLTIKNIDTDDLKQEILEVLKENKLNIDIKNLKFALPTLELKDLNPVKVSVIVSRIKHLPVEVEWVQKSAIIDGGEENG